MKSRQIIIYLIVFMALGLFYYLYDVRLSEKRQLLQEAANRIFDLEFEKVQNIKLISNGTTFLIVRDTPNQWRLTQPIETTADRWEVEGMIRQVINGKKDRAFKVSPDQLADYGLDQPSLELTLADGPQNLAPPLTIGDQNPTGLLYYARLGQDNEIFTIAASLRDGLDKRLFDLRDKSLILADAEDMDGLRLRGRDTIVLEKKGIRRWAVVKPEPGPADNDTVQRLIYQGLKKDVRKFVPPGQEDEDFGFDRPRIQIEILSQDRTVAELVVGRAAKPQEIDQDVSSDNPSAYWARSSERREWMLIDPETADLLDLAYSDVKDRHVLDLDRRSLDGLEIIAPGVTMKIKKTKNIWEVVDPADAATQDRDIEALLRSLENLKYEQILDAKPETVKKHGLDEPDIIITMTGPENTTRRLAISARSTEDRLAAARFENGPVVMVDRPDFFRWFPPEVRPDDNKQQNQK